MFRFTKSFDFRGYTFVVPAVSVGNVAQLAVDLLIETLKLEKCCQIWDLALVPVVGPSAYDHEQDPVTTAAELYVSAERKLLVLQMRSPLVAALQPAFLGRMVDFIREQQFADVLILSTSFAHEIHHVGARPYRYVANEQFHGAVPYGNRTTELQWNRHEAPIIHGGGYAMKLFDACTAGGIAALVLFSYVSEGDNTPDAVQLVSLLDLLRDSSLLPRLPEGKLDLAVPCSWKHLFGNAPPATIY